MNVLPDEASFYNVSLPDLTNFSSSSVDTNRSIDVDESATLKDTIETQEKHELICLEHNKHNKIILKEGKAFFSQLERYNNISPTMTPKTDTTADTSSLNDNVFVVSFLGDTASGKSFLANHLQGVQSFVFGESEHRGSTTANVTCFESTCIINTEQKSNCLVLDFEGENGSWFPRILRRLADFVFSPEQAKHRRDSVASYFPTLAYLLSNVIILIGQDDLFSNSRYIERAKKFAAQAVGPVQQNMYKPVLILVQNKYAGENVLSPREATRKFYQTNPDAKDLELFFSAVRCIVLPFKHTETTSGINKKFDAQMVVLQKLLTSICEQYQNRLLPHLPWLLLTRQVIKKLSNGETIMMHMVLQDVLIKEKNKDHDYIISFLFRRLYEKKNIHSRRWFHHCRYFAIDVLARFTACRLPKYQCEGIEEFIKKECEDRLKELWKMLDEYRPCEVLYMDRGYVKDQNRPVFCYQHKGAHDSMHQTSEVVHGASWWRALFNRFIELSTIDKWDGSFQTNDTTSDNPGDDMHRKLLETTNEYLFELTHDPKGIYTTFNRMLQKWNIDITFEQLYDRNACFCCFESINNSNSRDLSQKSIICSTCYEELRTYQQDNCAQRDMRLSTSVNENDCVICMSSPRQVAFTPCGHYRCCDPCAKKIFVRFKLSLLCKQAVKGIQKIY